jgi:hypothetical protein
MGIRIVYGKNVWDINYEQNEEEAVQAIKATLESSDGMPHTVEKMDDDGIVEHLYEVEITVTLKPVAARES